MNSYETCLCSMKTTGYELLIKTFYCQSCFSEKQEIIIIHSGQREVKISQIQLLPSCADDNIWSQGLCSGSCGPILSCSIKVPPIPPVHSVSSRAQLSIITSNLLFIESNQSYQKNEHLNIRVIRRI